MIDMSDAWQQLQGSYNDGPKTVMPTDLVNITYEDLQAYIDSLDLSDADVESSDLRVISLEEKLRINGLSETTKQDILRGLSYSHSVNDVVMMKTRFGMQEFPMLLLKCFRRAYYEFYSNGKRNDNLFFLMCRHLESKCATVNVDLQKVRLCVLAIVAYLFERCDLFDKTESGKRETGAAA